MYFDQVKARTFEPFDYTPLALTVLITYDFAEEHGIRMLKAPLLATRVYALATG